MSICCKYTHRENEELTPRRVPRFIICFWFTIRKKMFASTSSLALSLSRFLTWSRGVTRLGAKYCAACLPNAFARSPTRPTAPLITSSFGAEVDTCFSLWAEAAVQLEGKEIRYIYVCIKDRRKPTTQIDPSTAMSPTARIRGGTYKRTSMALRSTKITPRAMFKL